MSIKYNDNGTFKDIKVKVGDNIPVGAEFDYDGSTIPVGYEEVENPNNYSTDEVRIGTWIDGKPLYRKVYTLDFTTYTSPNDKYVEMDLGTIQADTITKINGTLKRINLNLVNSSGYIFEPVVILSTGKLRFTAINNASFTSGDKFRIALEYTKTTD